MTIEEKARAYDKAIERAKDFMNGEVHYALRRGENIMCWIFPELKESEDEKIRKEIIEFIKVSKPEWENYSDYSSWISWLKKQGEHQKFRDSIQVGDKVTRNEDGALVNLSQLNRVAKKEESHSSQLTVEMEDVLNKYIDMQNNSKDPCEGCDYKVKNCHNFPCDRKKTFDEQKPANKVEPKFREGEWITIKE